MGFFARLAAIALILLATACGSAPSPSPEPAVSLENVANGPNPPPGEPVRVERIRLTEDGLTLHLMFTGGRPYDPADPCTNHYFGWAHEIDGVLEFKVVDDTPPFPPLPEGFGCDLVGFGRTITIELETPFRGDRAHDAAGVDHLFHPPDGLVDVPMPAGWTLQNDSQNVDVPGIVWARRWILDGTDGTGDRDQVVFQQVFGGPALITGGDEIRDVQVNGSPARLYRHRESGELVVVWMLDQDGLALVANEAQFPADELIRLAERVARP